MKRSQVTWWIIVGLSLFAPSRAIPDAYQDGLEHWKKRMYKEAYRLLKQHRARAGGSPELDYMLGTAACRAGADGDGVSLLQSMLVRYRGRLSAEDLEAITAERDDCHAIALAVAGADKPHPGYRGEFSVSRPRLFSGQEIARTEADAPAQAEAAPPQPNPHKIKRAHPKGNGLLDLKGFVPAGGELVLIGENQAPKTTGVLRFKFTAPTAGNYALNFCIGPRSNPCGLATSRVVKVPGGEERREEVDASVFKDNVLTVGQGTAAPLPYSMTLE